MRYVGECVAKKNEKRGYVYHSTEYKGNSAVICHNPYLFYSSGKFNFDVPEETIVVIFRIKKRTVINRILYFLKKLSIKWLNCAA